MTQRRFTEKPSLSPGAVRSLEASHAALTENRTLFPSQVVEVTQSEPGRLLISGRENRKLGETVTKGAFAGYKLYSLSLEERATCPVDCAARAYCYGNGMQYARRLKIGDRDTFFDRLATELAQLCASEKGILVRLHVLGDFPDSEYVAFWKDALAEDPNLACFGYTHWSPDSEIGETINSLKQEYPVRFRIRQSLNNDLLLPDTTIVTDVISEGPETVSGALVCPAQTDETACCASCGLCWAGAVKTRQIAFIKHGPTSAAAALETIKKKADAVNENAEQETGEDDESPEFLEGVRTVNALDIGGLEPAELTESAPEFILIDPASLLIEESYQRELSSKSISLIRKIVNEWDWLHFKPPIVAEDNGYYFCIDGQHTALAAATHPGIDEIPCMCVSDRAEVARAKAFVNQNVVRNKVTPYDIYHAELTAGIHGAPEFQAVIDAAGYSIPRSAPGRAGEPWTIEGVGAARAMFKNAPDLFDGLLEVAVEADGVVMSKHLISVWDALHKSPRWQPIDRSVIASRLGAMENFDVLSRDLSRETDQTRTRAGCVLLSEGSHE